MYQNGNLTSRKDNLKGLTETFGYTDNLNRLNSYQVTGLCGLAVGYKPNGNIDTKTDAGTYTYSSTTPHGVQSVSNTANFPLLTQNITYTPFNKPAPKPASNSERRKNW